MYAGKVVSYKTIVEKVFRDFAFNYDINDEECLEWLAEFLAHTNVPVIMYNTVDYIEICDGRGELPANLYKITQTAELTGITTIEEAYCGKGTKSPMRWSTDNFHKRYHIDNRDYTTQSNNTYTVGQGFIFPSFHKGFIALSYVAIPTDEEGYPTIPAEQPWLEGAAFFIGYKIARKLWIRNEITVDKMQFFERDRDWYFAQAVNHAKQWNGVDEAESVKNSVVRTIPAMQDHSTFFANMQIPEMRNFREKTSGNTVRPYPITQSKDNIA